MSQGTNTVKGAEAMMSSGSRELPTVEDTQQLGREVGKLLRAGDVVVLDGPLGAGKTAMTVGIAQGLGVAGRVTSPTFVIAREHQPLVSGRPGMVHVDAYRLLGDDVDSSFTHENESDSPVEHNDAAGDIADTEDTEQSTREIRRIDLRDELESLDLDSMIDSSVLVVEWGAGFVEEVGERVLTIKLRRRPGTDVRTVSWSWSGQDG